MRPLLIAVACCGLMSTMPTGLPAQESAADILPGSTAVYLELAKPGALLDEIVEHPFLRELSIQ